MERGLRQSRAIDTEALCIVSGEKVNVIAEDGSDGFRSGLSESISESLMIMATSQIVAVSALLQLCNTSAGRTSRSDLKL